MSPLNYIVPLHVLILRSSTVIHQTNTLRSYSALPQLKQEEEDDFFGDLLEPSASTSSRVEMPAESSTSRPEPITNQIPVQPIKPLVNLTPFTSLKGRINHDVLKALTVKPFQLTAMSEVQKRVLNLMPELSGGRLHGDARIAVEAAAEAAQAAGEEVSAEPRGRDDLLVKVSLGFR